MPTIRLHDVNIYYESHGSGFPLVLTYGLGGNTCMWAGQVGAFASNYRLIVWDPCGHGKSESPQYPKQYGTQMAAEHLHRLLNHLDIKRAYVGGLSMGGGIAARFAMAHPERVAALLLFDRRRRQGFRGPRW